MLLPTIPILKSIADHFPLQANQLQTLLAETPQVKLTAEKKPDDKIETQKQNNREKTQLRIQIIDQANTLMCLSYLLINMYNCFHERAL